MAIPGDLLKINNETVSGLKQYTVEYAKLWKDADRNMAGNISASLIGVFTKITLGFRAGLTDAQLAGIISKLNQAYFSATYYDPATQTTKTEQFYASDFKVEMLSKTLDLYDEFSVSLIATAKRS